jgi:polysaccharide pyruvyl transferase WcaK-like protein
MVRGCKKIGLLDHIGGGNLGDDATQTAVMHEIKVRWPDSVICGFSMNPSDSQSRHGIPCYAIRRKMWVFPYRNSRAEFNNKVKAALSEHRLLLWLLRAINTIAIRWPSEVVSESIFLVRSFRVIRTFDILIISGGGQLLESWGGPWSYPYTIFKWIVLAKLSRVKCYFINVGAGPLKRPLSKYFVTRALHLADYASFRDAKSRALAQEVGFTGKADVFPDCVYGLNVHPFNASRVEARHKPHNPIVGLSPMAFCDPRRYWIQDLGAYEAFIRKFALFGSWLSHRYSLLLFSTDIWFDSQTLEELDVALKNANGMADISVLTHEVITNTEALLSQMSSMDYVVTCRFHGVIFAHLMNIPVIAISHHPKVATLMTDLGLSEYCLDAHSFDAELLATTFTRMVSDKERIKAHMAEKAALYRKALTSQFDRLFASGGDEMSLRALELSRSRGGVARLEPVRRQKRLPGGS